MSTHEHKIKKALTALVFDHGFYGQLAMGRLEIKVGSFKFGMATDGVHLFYSPTWIVNAPDWEVATITAHEVVHCANGHPWRRSGRDPKLWNIACDHVANLILLEDGFKLWKGAYHDERFIGWSAEEVYGQLLREREEQPQQQKPEKKDSSSTKQSKEEPEEQEDQDSPDQDGSDSAEDDAQEPSEEPEDADQCEGDSEPGDAGDEPQDASGVDLEEEEEEENQQPGAMIDPPAGTVDPDSLQAEWTVAVFNAAQAAQAAGKLPAGLKRLMTEARQPQVDWKALTRRFVQMLAQDDYTMRSPNPHYIHLGLYMPKLESESIPRVYVLWDTSGSRDYDAARKECAAEIISIIEECRPESTTVIYVDAEVQAVEEFLPGDPIVFDPVGGGGTCFKPAFDYIEAQGDVPACVMVLTDLDIWDLDQIQDPGYPVIWLKIGGCRKTAPFGEVIEVEPEHRHY